MADFITLKDTGYARKEFRSSLFIAHAAPISNEEDAKELINSIKDKHSDANNNVSAYLIKKDCELAMKYDDDGEPAGSSGKPVFRVLEMKELTNVVVIVTRYFGGVKLGFGGLSRAYRETTIEAIDNAGICEIYEKTLIHLESGYHDADTVMRIIPTYGEIVSTDYSDVVLFEASINSELEDAFIENITNATKNRVTVK